MVVAHVGLIDVVGHHAEGGEEEPLLVAVDLVDHGARAARAFDDAGEGRALVAVLDENVDGAAKELDRTVAASGGFRKSVGHVLLRVLVGGSRLNRLRAGFRALYPSGAMREWRRDSGCLKNGVILTDRPRDRMRPLHSARELLLLLAAAFLLHAGATSAGVIPENLIIGSPLPLCSLF